MDCGKSVVFCKRHGPGETNQVGKTGTTPTLQHRGARGSIAWSRETDALGVVHCFAVADKGIQEPRNAWDN